MSEMYLSFLKFLGNLALMAGLLFLFCFCASLIWNDVMPHFGVARASPFNILSLLLLLSLLKASPVDYFFNKLGRTNEKQESRTG